MAIRQIASTGEYVPDSTPAAADATKTKLSATTIHIKVHSPFRIYFDDEAKSISAVSATGPFDILPKHHNFMTLLRPCELVIETEKGEQRIRIAQGIMHVKANEVIVFLDV